ncbi:MAG: SpoIIE family protein phosphatase [Armatimonadetes bacterium]|nr:SpoIIE family protein phosphatase [Armatimonadota bacterium]
MAGAAVVQKATAAPAGSNGRPEVLVVDDNLGLAEVWGFLLEDAGYAVTLAGSAGDALAAAAHTAFDAAVLDLQLPDLSGLELFAALRADIPDIEGVLITGHATTESAIEATNRGLFSYLVKPASPDQVRLLTARALERKRIQSENRQMLSHLSALQDVLDAALESVGLTDVMQRVLRAVVAATDADGARLLLQEPDGSLAVKAAHPFEDEVALSIRQSSSEGFAGRIFSQHRPLQISDAVRSPIVASSYLRTAGLRSLLGVPLLVGDRAIGVLQIGTRRDQSFSDRDVRLLEAIAQRTVLAIEKARLLEEREQHLRQVEQAYERERRIAETLQRSLLPDLRIHVSGLQIAYLYQAAMIEAEVGGDFYDMVELRDGLVGVIIGDVSGKGLDAAVYTALAKYTLRSYALEDPDPGRVLERLNRAFARQSGEETFATLFFGVVDLVPGRLVYASAGHEPGLLHHPDRGATERLPATGPIAGVLPDASYGTVEVAFTNHDVLLLYTDGASDARRDNEFLGPEGLQRLLESCLQPDLQGALADIYDGILRFSRRRLRDDTALLLLRRRPEELTAG